MRIKILILSFCLILSGRNLIGQNLVPNPSFENVKECPTGVRLENIHNWFETCYPYSWVFLLSKCNENSPYSLYATPINLFGFQHPHTGYNYISIAIYDNDEIRFYPQVKLKKSLDKKKYYIRLHISLADYSSFAISNIGVHFSMDTIKGKYKKLVELEPSYENPPNNILRDSVNWMVINGTYEATGGEQFMTIGNFRSNENTNVDTLKDYADGYTDYFIDDIAVWEDGAISYPANAGNDRAVCAIDGDSVALGTSNYDDYFYEWTPSEGLNSTTTGRPMAKPTTTTMYYLKQKDFKFDETIDSVLVLISDQCDTIVSIENSSLSIINYQLSIYPNPANDKLYIKTTSKKPNIFVEISNIYGQKVIDNGELRIALRRTSFENSIAVVDISYLDRGIYFVKVNGVTLKFVKL